MNGDREVEEPVVPDGNQKWTSLPSRWKRAAEERWLSMRNKFLVKHLPTNIIFKHITCRHGVPLDNTVYAAAFTTIKLKFGQAYCGFYDWTTIYDREMTKREMTSCRNQHVSGVKGLSFLFRVTNETPTLVEYHTALAYYHPFTNECLIYESSPIERVKDEIHPDYLRELAQYYGHLVNDMHITYVKHFARQWDEWTCSLHALFAAICVLAQVDPTHYKIRVDETFQMAKEAVEKGSNAFKGRSIYHLLHQVAQKKKVYSLTKDTAKKYNLADILRATAKKTHD